MTNKDWFKKKNVRESIILSLSDIISKGNERYKYGIESFLNILKTPAMEYDLDVCCNKQTEDKRTLSLH